MAAYASLLSLARTLREILILDLYNDPRDKEKIVFLLEKVDFIVNFLEDYSEEHLGAVDRLGNRIKKAAYEAQDFMDSYLCSISRTEACHEVISVEQELNRALEKINFIWEEAAKMKNIDTAEDRRPITYFSPADHSSTGRITAKDMIVGFDDDLNAIKERLFEDSTKLQIIPIVGMGGIGKTTLATRAYDDSLLTRHFDISAWITVSVEYQRAQILSGLLHCLKKLGREQSHQSDNQLATLVYQNLTGRRYLIVIDDIWSTKAWDDLKMIFPDDGNGSRILLTTRLSDVAVYAGSSSTSFHQMDFLNEDQSWKLLQARIFGYKSCPLHLVEIGKKIARNCGGLPLTIMVVAGLLLSSGNMMKEEFWENILENISSRRPQIAQHCSKILSLSYDKLPLQLKPCFLYIAAFPEDSEIDVFKLIMLWVAEGFLKSGDQSKCLEDVGEGYLEDLVNRSLILVNKRGPNGKLETIGIHDLLREICIRYAKEEGFLHHVFSEMNAWKYAEQNPNRRISIHFTKSFKECRIEESSVCSLLFFSKRNSGLRLYLTCTRLVVLDAPGVSWMNFSDVISMFVNLRYIAFALNYTTNPDGFPVSISKLPNLQTIITYKYDYRPLQIPYEILGATKLRHLITNIPFRFSYPSKIISIHKSDLQTLETVINFSFTEELIKILVNLRRLKVDFDMYDDHWDDLTLKNLFRLQKLEELQVTMLQNNRSMIWNHAFPVGLKKLTLQGVPLAWKNMSIIGSLPNLLALEMMYICAPELSEWLPVEGQFVRLKYFRCSLDNVSKWEVEKEQFPSLESLILVYVPLIEEIPYGIGEIDSLQLIELWFCKESLVSSAKRIQEQQHENGNHAFQVRVFGSSEKIYAI